jgi:hypothetical protein
LRFFRHPKKIKKARAAMKRLKTITRILIKDISRKLDEKQLKQYQKSLICSLKYQTKNKKILIRYIPFMNKTFMPLLKARTIRNMSTVPRLHL